MQRRTVGHDNHNTRGQRCTRRILTRIEVTHAVLRVAVILVTGRRFPHAVAVLRGPPPINFLPSIPGLLLFEPGWSEFSPLLHALVIYSRNKTLASATKGGQRRGQRVLKDQGTTAIMIRTGRIVQCKSEINRPSDVMRG